MTTALALAKSVPRKVVRKVDPLAHPAVDDAKKSSTAGLQHDAVFVQAKNIRAVRTIFDKDLWACQTRYLFDFEEGVEPGRLPPERNSQIQKLVGGEKADNSLRD